jgi:hypothetical protein
MGATSGVAADKHGWTASGRPGLGRAAPRARMGPLGLPVPRPPPVLSPRRSRCRASGLAWLEGHGRSQATLRVPTGAPHRRAAPALLLRRRRATGRPFPSPVPSVPCSAVQSKKETASPLYVSLSGE